MKEKYKQKIDRSELPSRVDIILHLEGIMGNRSLPPHVRLSAQNRYYELMGQLKTHESSTLRRFTINSHRVRKGMTGYGI